MKTAPQNTSTYTYNRKTNLRQQDKYIKSSHSWVSEIQKTTSTWTDYTKSYFEHSKLTKLHGKLAFESLKLFHNEIKANLTGISLYLRGGAYRYLGLALIYVEYDNIPPVLIIFSPDIQVLLLLLKPHSTRYWYLGRSESIRWGCLEGSRTWRRRW